MSRMSERQYWVIKSEPSVYPFAQLQNEGKTAWTGIRNFEARNNLRKMEPGDLALYYQTGEGKEIVGVARVVSAATADPTAPKEDWASVDLEPVTALKAPVSLSKIKSMPELAEFPLVTRSRLSVSPVRPKDFRRILALGKTPLP